MCVCLHDAKIAFMPILVLIDGYRDYNHMRT